MSSKAYEGVLITCDAAIRQYILHLDEQQQAAGAGVDSFVITRDLDETHLLVKEEAVDMIQAKVEELQASNSFTRPPDSTLDVEEEKAPKAPAAKKRKKKEAAT